MRWNGMTCWLFAATASAAMAESSKEAVVHVVNNWDLACSGAERCWSGMTSAWYNEVTKNTPAPGGHGGQAWLKDGNYVDSLTMSRDSSYTDSDLVDFGRDDWNDRIDDVDVAMLGLHGGNANSDNRWFGVVRVDEAGDGSCRTWQAEMELGETGADLEFLHLSSCVSMDQEDWHPNWSSSFQGVHQVNGFNGVMYIFCDGYPDRYRDFADDSFYIPIALAWLDNMYDIRDGIANDQCPVSRGAGYGQNDALNRLFTERYNNVLTDPVDPTWHHVLYIGPCSPSGGAFLPMPE